MEIKFLELSLVNIGYHIAMKNTETQILSNLQLELLKLYSQNVDEKDLTAIKKMIAQFFANKAMDTADQIWEEKGWTDKDSLRIAKTRLRSSELSQ